MWTKGWPQPRSCQEEPSPGPSQAPFDKAKIKADRAFLKLTKGRAVEPTWPQPPGC